MAIPPIINNLPIFKTAKSGEATQKESVVSAPSTAEDVVEISAEAQGRLDNVRTLSDNEAPEVAAQTGKLLANSDFTLGLDPSFDK